MSRTKDSNFKINDHIPPLSLSPLIKKNKKIDIKEKNIIILKEKIKNQEQTIDYLNKRLINYDETINEIARLNKEIKRLNEIIKNKNEIIFEFQNVSDLSKIKIEEMRKKYDKFLDSLIKENEEENNKLNKELKKKKKK